VGLFVCVVWDGRSPGVWRGMEGRPDERTARRAVISRGILAVLRFPPSSLARRHVLPPGLHTRTAGSPVLHFTPRPLAAPLPRSKQARHGGNGRQAPSGWRKSKVSARLLPLPRPSSPCQGGIRRPHCEDKAVSDRACVCMCVRRGRRLQEDAPSCGFPTLFPHGHIDFHRRSIERP
jgi:hypothetical protein